MERVPSIGRYLRAHRRLTLLTFDTAAWAFGIALAAIARRDFDPSLVSWGMTAVCWAIVAVLHALFGWASRLHEGRASVATVDELVWLCAVAGASGGFLFLVNMSFELIPRSIPITGAFVAIAVMVWGRAAYRRAVEAAAFRQGSRTAEQAVVIVGAGDGGRQLVRTLTHTAGSEWRPVAFVDDDPAKRHYRLYDVPVRGQVDDLAEVAASSGTETVIVAVPSAGPDLFRRVSEIAATHGLIVKVLPGVNELIRGKVEISDVRDIDMADVLGRHQIDTDIGSIAGYLTGKRVLVTGAGGSIGSELSRQISKFGPSELIMLDRDESALHAVQLSIEGRALLDSTNMVLCDIRDHDALAEIMAERMPQVVFHAAALKHLPMLEQYPTEAVKTNIVGTLNVLECAKGHGVERFVNISTDKAADPTSVLGYTKRIAEGLTADAADADSGAFLSVRFGNVLGSRGSVLTAFAAQIAGGGPVTVTHPDVTRYFMTIQEAVQLVIQAAAIGRGGEALVLDMGESVRIEDVARQLIAQSGKSIEVVYTGLRRGEKMHEDLLGTGEIDVRPVHELISHVSVPPVGRVVASSLARHGSRDAIVRRLEELCHTMETVQAEGTASGRSSAL